MAIKTANCQPAASNDVPKNTMFENRCGFAHSTVAPTIRLNSAVRIVTVLMRFDFFGGRSRGSGPNRPFGEGGGRGAVETVADTEAVADELIDTRDRAAGVGALGAEEDEGLVRGG